ncbi:MAG: glutamate--tRNA ligase [Patescibacteria group bacterium]|nr:glutamate--tRNA ligase [Patescibacteria group bacterium]
MNHKITTRFAPSPTGFMHVGGIRTALYSYLWAKKNDGKFILRIEDTDKEREVKGAVEHIKKSLSWLNLKYDEEFKQSERLNIYKKYAQKLINKGYAYPDPYTTEELEKMREGKKLFLFREHRPEKTEDWDGKKPLRFKVPEIKRYTWNDVVFGKLSAGEEALDDFVLIKSDGYPTYNFAHIVDDIEMGVTHVMRGQEFIPSIPKFLSLYEALEEDFPTFITLPLIMNGNKKLSKRDGAKDILDYKKEGYLSTAMINFLAFLGWNPGGEKELFLIEELIKEFSLEKIQKSGAQFNEEKLDWINKEHLKKLNNEKKKEYVLNFIPEEIKELSFWGESVIERSYNHIIERIHKGSDISKLLKEGELCLFGNIKTIQDNLIWKKDSKENTKKYLEECLDLIEDFESPEKAKEVIWPLTEKYGTGNVLWPLRIALSSKKKSADPFTFLHLLGKEESQKRIQNAINIL